MSSAIATREAARQFLRKAVIQFDNLVEHFGELAGQPGPFQRQADGAVAFFQGSKGRQQYFNLAVGDGLPLYDVHGSSPGKYIF